MDISEAEIRKQAAYLKSLQAYLNESQANMKDLDKIIEMYQHPLHRQLKQNAYPLLKTFDQLGSLHSTIEQDLQSPDPETQLTSLKLLYSLPNNQIIDMVKTHDTQINKIIFDPSQEFYYEKITVLHSIFLKVVSLET